MSNAPGLLKVSLLTPSTIGRQLSEVGFVKADFKSGADVVSGILPTGIRFGPEGALYAADWVFGWDTKNYGRVWKLDVDDKNKDLTEERAQTKIYIQQDYSLNTYNLL